MSEEVKLETEENGTSETVNTEEKNGNRTLGLQDLYKAAFSQEVSEKNESDEIYSYPVKQLTFETVGTDEGFSTTTPLTSYSVYEASDTNSVLDLDKGIPVQVVKLNEFPTYTCDSQILQRYLHEATLVKSGDGANDLSNAASETLLYFTKYEDEPSISYPQPEVKFEDCDFNSSDSFASTESIIPKDIQCPKCPKKFMFKSDLTRHDRHKHSNKQKLTCLQCGKEFTNQQILLFHEKSHKKEADKKSCNICNKNFKKTSYYLKHMREKHKDNFSCSICSLNFLTHQEFLAHNRKNHVGKPFCCEQCDRRFESKSGLTCHVNKCHKEVSVHCEQCGEQFTKALYLKEHKEKIHKVPVICVNINAHVPIAEVQNNQTTQKPYKCDTCLKSFVSKSNFTVHLRKHSETVTNSPPPEKGHECQLCGKMFPIPSKLSRHMRTHQTVNPVCPYCSEQFSSKTAMNTHIKQNHNRKMTQETCTQTGEDLLELQNVNIVMDPTLPIPESIVLTPVGGYNSVPFIITQPQTSTVPYSMAS